MLAASGDAVRYPVPGQRVDIGGYSLHLLCLGQGSPAVILDAGLGGTSRDWVLVQSRLAADTRVCAYDRAGMGHSDPGPELRSPARIADELQRLVKSAGVPGPYVLVAHSLSGKSARLFAAAHPDVVAGMVLVDTRSEKIDAATPPDEAEAFAVALKRRANLLTLARKLGLVRLLGSILTDVPSLPPGVATEMALLQTQPQSLRATTAEGLARSTDDAALNSVSLGEIPLVVIAAGDSMASIPGWAEAQEELSALSREGRLVVAEGSSHLVQIDQPEIVIDAVLSVLDAARKVE
ncbi:alpha/beta fold hydrolase [Rhodobacter sp. SY28-1]|uniref:alpha/beta fold hydrolase n=1 Tax=Rhodobacter sp. SY28-1 TaxID=2562317 RepID=UPI0014855068|nr:alpha/beta hydrolase [Rhodobacter sp. SY28-1]